MELETALAVNPELSLAQNGFELVSALSLLLAQRGKVLFGEFAWRLARTIRLPTRKLLAPVTLHDTIVSGTGQRPMRKPSSALARFLRGKLQASCPHPLTPSYLRLPMMSRTAALAAYTRGGLGGMQKKVTKKEAREQRMVENRAVRRDVMVQISANGPSFRGYREG